jgi:hypothetical protein
LRPYGVQGGKNNPIMLPADTSHHNQPEFGVLEKKMNPVLPAKKIEIPGIVKN